MKNVILLAGALLVAHVGFSQKYAASKASVKFFSEAPMEDIDATTEKAKSMLDIETGDVVVVIPIVTFHFEKPLMEEHFNENYMESTKYPNGIFQGKVNEKIDYKSDGSHDITVTGNMTIHGVKKEYTLVGKMVIKGDQIQVDGKFMIKLEDHEVEIPKLVIKNIAEEVEVTVAFTYEPKK